MFFFRINKIKIFDNHSSKFLGIFGKDLAEVQLLSFVNTDLSGFLPNLDELIQSNSEERKNEILEDMVRQVVSSRIITPIENVKDNHQLTFGDTGYVLFQSKQIPDFFDWQLIVLESDKNIRDTGKIVESVLNSSDLSSLTSTITGLLKLTNPAVAATSVISKFVLQNIAQNAKANKDDMIGFLLMSLNRQEHYLHGERKKDDVSDLTNNMLVDYSIFAFEEK